MKIFSPKFFYFLFFFSGLSGLIYEVIWIRLFVLVFGSTTSSVVAVISAFLAGLAVGSFLFGKISDKLESPKLVKFYSFLELGVGASAVVSLFLIPKLKYIYQFLSDGSSQSLSLTLAKFFFCALIILPSTILMGATLPILARALSTVNKKLDINVSYLYAANTFGAVSGTLLSAFILIELIGLSKSLLLAAAINLLIALLARMVKVKEFKNSKLELTTLPFQKLLDKKSMFVIFVFGVSGLIAIAYEIIWTRILTPTVGTFIYSFAAILSIYLFGISFGSLIYRPYSRFFKDKLLSIAFLQFLIGFFALLTAFLTSSYIHLGKNMLVLLVILPTTICSGITFPAVIAALNTKSNGGKIIGISYFSNTFASIIGAFLASFFLLPKIGSNQSVVLLSIGNFALALSLILFTKKAVFIKYALLIPVCFLIIFASYISIFKKDSIYENTTQWRINWARQKDIDFIFKEDEVASVFAYYDKKRKDQNLFIDGVPTTGKVGDTKLMIHIPFLLHKNPKDALVIAFGMGTTYRSSLLLGLNTDVVELVPSVPKMFGFFHNDASQILNNPNGKIIINDGRNYVSLTKKKYDIVTIDPPPPFNSAGTTVLYSEEFYRDIAKKLKIGGIVSQWIWFGSTRQDIEMAIKSFIDIFPNVLAFRPYRNASGIFIEGSFSQIDFNKNAIISNSQMPIIISDLNEIYLDFKAEELPELKISERENLFEITKNSGKITDDNPNTEYFMIRHKLTKSAPLNQNKEAEAFIRQISD